MDRVKVRYPQFRVQKNYERSEVNLSHTGEQLHVQGERAMIPSTPEQMGHQVPQGTVVRVRQLRQEGLQRANTLRAGAGGPRVVPGVCMQGLCQRDEGVVEVEGDHGISELVGTGVGGALRFSARGYVALPTTSGPEPPTS